MTTATRVTVGTTPTLVISDRSIAQGNYRLKNIGAATVFLGDDAVTIATGFELAAAEEQPYTLSRGEDLYGIVASGTCVVEAILT